MIGIISLDTKFPRLLGDIGNPESFRSPTKFIRVPEATVKSIVTPSGVNDQLLVALISAAKQLENENVNVIGTSCGFLSCVQQEIQAVVSVPFISSSLVLIPILQSLFGFETKIGVLTFDASKLSDIHLNGQSGQNIHINGLEQTGELYQCVVDNHSTIDENLAEKDVLRVARECVTAHPDIKLLVLECTNLSPWKNRLRSEFNLPVFDLVDTLEWINSAYAMR